MKLSINLASRRHLNQRAIRLVLGCLIGGLALVLVFQGNIYLRDRQQMLEYRARLAELQEQLRGKLPQRLTPADFADQRLAYERAETLLERDAFRWTALFDQMEALLPEGISLRSFRPDHAKNSIALHGVAKDLSSLQALLDKLHEGPFSRVYLENQGTVDVDDGRGGKRPALSFSISLAGGVQ